MPEPTHIQFLADENFDLNIVKLLREEGFSVNAIAEIAPTITDPQVLTMAVEQKAVLLTEDKDFGELVYRLRLPHCGILLVRLLRMDPADKAARGLATLRQHAPELLNAFAVLSNENLRIKLSEGK